MKEIGEKLSPPLTYSNVNRRIPRVISSFIMFFASELKREIRIINHDGFTKSKKLAEIIKIILPEVYEHWYRSQTSSKDTELIE
ncbi:MAG: hypothetical protein QNJ31_08510 [Candidatus Caenarcaniphilales bacterium]|nr:hypothetical protein [Candidatus Caenarcaniphilales bacterium]